MKNLAKPIGVKLLACAVALASLAACGGGGGAGGGFLPLPSGSGGTTVTGTAGGPPMLVGAAVSMTCANGATLTGATTGLGGYITNAAVLAYPCVGTATLGALSYRGALFAGTVANFTPMTDMMVEVMLAASATGAASMAMGEFLAKIGKDGTFASNVAAAAPSYRATVLDVMKAQLMANGKTEAEADAILQPARTRNFDAQSFVIGSDLDKVLGNSAAVLQNTDGSVKASVLTSVKAAGDALPLPASGATGGTGTSGG